MTDDRCMGFSACHQMRQFVRFFTMAFALTVTATSSQAQAADDGVYQAMKRRAADECEKWSASQSKRVDVSGLGPHARANALQSLTLSLEGECLSGEGAAIDQIDDLRLTGKVSADKINTCIDFVRSTTSDELFFGRILECVTRRY